MLIVLIFTAAIMVLQQTGYSVSSFFVGVAMDSNSPKTLFAVGMFLSGFFNFGFSGMFVCVCHFRHIRTHK